MRLQQTCVVVLVLINCLAAGAQTSQSAAGLDALSDQALMNELAARGMTTLLDRAFEINHVPRAEQEGRRALLALRQIADKDSALTAAQRQDLMAKVVAGISSALPSLTDPDTLMQQAQVLVTQGVDPLVNQLEYWGESPAKMNQLRPLAEAVIRIYERAAELAQQQIGVLGNAMKGPNDPAGTRLMHLDQLSNIATYSARMTDYALALSLDPADAKRKQVADRSIEYLKEFDNPDEEIRPVVRLRIAKLNLVKGDFEKARQLFDSLIQQGKEPFKPAPGVAQQYEARYFRAVTDVQDRKIADAQKELKDLLAWQQSNLPKDKPTQDGASAAAAMLEYRIDSARAEAAGSPAEKDKANQQAVAVLSNLVKARPDLQGVINELIVTKLPENVELKNLEPLLLGAIVRRGESEVRRGAAEQADQSVLRRAVEAANEIAARSSRGGVDPQLLEQSRLVLPYLLEKLGRDADAASAFLDDAQHTANLERSTAALDNAQAIIGRLRKLDPDDAATIKVYERFLPIAIAPPFSRTQFAFEYARRLQQLGKYQQAVEYFHKIPADDKRQLEARYFEMIATKQLLDTLPGNQPSRGALVSDVQKLADEVVKGAAAMETSGDARQKSNARSMTVRTRLLAAELARVDEKNPSRALSLLENFEESAKGMPNENALLSEALLIRVQSYIALGQNTKATDALVKLLSTREGGQGAAIVYSLLQKLNADFDKAQAAGDRAAMKVLAGNRAALSGFLVDWARNNTDPNIKKFTYRYSVFEADTKHRAAGLEDDPQKRKTELENALKLYTALDSPQALAEYQQTLAPADAARVTYDPAVARGIAMIQYDLGNFTEAQQRLARLLADGKLGSALIDVDENGQTRTIDNDAYWEAVLKLIRANLALGADAENQKNFLKSQYIRWGNHVGGTKWKAEFERLRKELIPDYQIESATAPATQPA
jgi:hypothetical protein